MKEQMSRRFPRRILQPFTVFAILVYWPLFSTSRLFRRISVEERSSDDSPPIPLLNQSNLQEDNDTVANHEYPSSLLSSKDLLRLYDTLPNHTTSSSEIPPFRDVTFAFSRQKSVSSTHDISLVTQISISKLSRLQFLLKRWNGPISCAVYLPSHESILELCRFLEHNNNGPQFRDYVTIHVMLERTSSPTDYPINHLRNLALHNIETDYFFYNDVDFMPIQDAHDQLARFLMEKRNQEGSFQIMSTLYVLPAFEIFGDDNKKSFATVTSLEQAPDEKDSLVNMVKDKQAQPFHMDYFPQGHGATDYNQWYKCSGNATTYPIDYGGKNFEPYVLASRHGIPDFLEQFRGFGCNKKTWIAELHYMGYEFQVLCNHFVAHMNHVERKNRKISSNTMAACNWFEQEYVPGHYRIDDPATVELDCGCPNSCNAQVLKSKSDTLPFACQDRIRYLMATYGHSQARACSAAVEEDACGVACDPDRCEPAVNVPKKKPIGHSFKVQRKDAVASRSNQHSRGKEANVDCGCPKTCNAKALAKQRNGLPFSCKDRIHHFMMDYGLSQENACSAAVEGGACGAECNPNVCQPVEPPKQALDCGCPSTCDTISLGQQMNGNTFSCKDRIQFLMDTYDSSETDACATAVEESACSVECDPLQCLPEAKPNATTTISSCLLVMDDTIKLTEWLAYHYSVLPLSHLVVAVDPRSSNADEIHRVLSLWKPRLDYIETWTSDTWMTLKPQEGWPPIAYGRTGQLRSRVTPYMEHKRRQEHFAVQCMRHLKTVHPSWVTITDTDEFLVFNYKNASRDDAFVYERNTTSNAADHKHLLPPLDQVTITDFLNNNRVKNCIKVPALQISAHESNLTDVVKNVPSSIDAKTLMTLRHRKHGKAQGDFTKCLINLQKVPLEAIQQSHVRTIHNPLVTICGKYKNEYIGTDYNSSMLRLNHYAGTLQSFQERMGDARQQRNFSKRNVEPLGETDDVRPWVAAFVNKVGVEEATRLLKPLSDAYRDTDWSAVWSNAS